MLWEENADLKLDSRYCMFTKVGRRDAEVMLSEEEGTHLRRILTILAVGFMGLGIPICHYSFGSDYTVYSIYQGLNLGNVGEVIHKDFYVNMGSSQGLATGSKLQVYRHTPTFDLVSQQVYREVTFPIAVIKVIHVEPQVAIARLEKFLPVEETATISPKAVMVGDLVKVVNASAK
ncbi:MAG: hypothetical protein ABIQ95_11570 [Bdellovibrionia bacterium]